MGEADVHGDRAVKGSEEGGGGHLTCWVPISPFPAQHNEDP